MRITGLKSVSIQVDGTSALIAEVGQDNSPVEKINAAWINQEFLGLMRREHQNTWNSGNDVLLVYSDADCNYRIINCRRIDDAMATHIQQVSV